MPRGLMSATPSADSNIKPRGLWLYPSRPPIGGSAREKAHELRGKSLRKCTWGNLQSQAVADVALRSGNRIQRKSKVGIFGWSVSSWHIDLTMF
jgi:hypothetical protein